MLDDYAVRCYLRRVSRIILMMRWYSRHYQQRTKLMEQEHCGSTKVYGPPGNIFSDAIRAGVKIRNMVNRKGKGRANSIETSDTAVSPTSLESGTSPRSPTTAFSAGVAPHAYWSRPPPFTETQEAVAANQNRNPTPTVLQTSSVPQRPRRDPSEVYYISS